MKKQIVIPLVILTVVIVVAISKLQSPKAIYYCPVISASGEKIAYIKRIVNYSVKGGSIMPFMGQPPKVKVRSDRIQLCERIIKNGQEAALEHWLIPLAKRDSLGNIWPELDWHSEELYYKIRLTNFGDIAVGERTNGPSGLEWILTNVKDNKTISKGPTEAEGIKVMLDSDPERIRFPQSNKLIIEKIK